MKTIREEMLVFGCRLDQAREFRLGDIKQMQREVGRRRKATRPLGPVAGHRQSRHYHYQARGV